jgi:hypothetical protein
MRESHQNHNLLAAFQGAIAITGACAGASDENEKILHLISNSFIWLHQTDQK